MAVREFPALGFDPAPGDAAALSSAAADVTGAGRVFSDASANVSTLNSSAWTGDAADAFRALREAVVQARSAGVGRDTVEQQLRALREHLQRAGRDADEDVVLEVMDFLAGWSSPHMRID